MTLPGQEEWYFTGVMWHDGCRIEAKISIYPLGLEDGRGYGFRIEGVTRRKDRPAVEKPRLPPNAPRYATLEEATNAARATMIGWLAEQSGAKMPNENWNPLRAFG